MNDKELLKQADEFLDTAFLGDGYREQSLMYKMKSRLEELTADLEPPSIVWEPREDEKYYYVNSDGTVHFTYWKSFHFDCNALNHHNVYKTYEQAEKAAAHQNRYNMVLQAVRNLEPDQVVYWKDENQKKYQVYFNHQFGLWEGSWTFYFDQGYPVITDKKNVKPLLDLLNAKEKENG